MPARAERGSGAPRSPSLPRPLPEPLAGSLLAALAAEDEDAQDEAFAARAAAIAPEDRTGPPTPGLDDLPDDEPPAGFAGGPGPKGDLDPDGRWVTVQGQHIHIDGQGEIEAGGHPALRQAMEGKAGKGQAQPAQAQPAQAQAAKAQGKHPADEAKLPAVGSKVKLDGISHVVEPLDGDDTFPPAIQSYRLDGGHVVYAGKDGSEGVVSGTREAMRKWMDEVDKAAKAAPPPETPRPWTEADGGKELVAKARQSAINAAGAFGLKHPEVDFLHADGHSKMGGEAGPYRLAVVNAHKDLPAPLAYPSPRTTQGMHVAAHEVAHHAFTANPGLGKEIMERAWKVGKPVSTYGGLSGAFEHAMELAAAYVNDQASLKAHSPELHALAKEWTRRSRAAEAAKAKEAAKAGGGKPEPAKPEPAKPAAVKPPAPEKPAPEKPPAAKPKAGPAKPDAKPGSPEAQHPYFQKLQEPAGQKLVASAVKDAAYFRKKKGLPPAEHELVLLPLAAVKPSQSGEDYDNVSSRELAKHIKEYGKSERWDDYKPIIVDEAGTILDGNHRHAASTMAGLTHIPAIRPRAKG